MKNLFFFVGKGTCSCCKGVWQIGWGSELTSCEGQVGTEQTQNRIRRTQGNYSQLSTNIYLAELFLFICFIFFNIKYSNAYSLFHLTCLFVTFSFKINWKSWWLCSKVNSVWCCSYASGNQEQIVTSVTKTEGIQRRRPSNQGWLSGYD